MPWGSDTPEVWMMFNALVDFLSAFVVFFLFSQDSC